MNIRKTPFRVAQVFALLLLAAVPAISQSQRVIYTTDNPPTVCAPGKIYTNATTHKTYQGNSDSTCTRIDAGAASGGGAPTTVTYITETPDATLSAEFALNSLADGILKHVSGVPARAVPGTDYEAAGVDLRIANNLSDLNSASTARTNLGGTTAGQNLFTLANPSAVRFLQINADNSVTAQSASSQLTALGGVATTRNVNTTSPLGGGGALSSDLTLTCSTCTTTIASGTSALGTSAIASGACATVVTTSATGTATTDTIGWGFNGNPTSTTGYQASANGMLTIIAYPSTNNVNFLACNNTSASITPGAITLNWKVTR